MLNSHHIRRHVAGCGVALALLGSTAAAAQPVDPFPRPVATPRQDVRSPDPRDAADAPGPRQDLRSGDARDADSFYRPVIPPTAPAAVSTTTTTDTGTTVDWPMILLATGGYLMAVVVAAWAFAALRNGRRRRVAA